VVYVLDIPRRRLMEDPKQVVLDLELADPEWRIGYH
jgi:hypothetical protein